MKYIPFIFILALQSLAQFFPQVLVNTNGVVQYPTNFFVANSNALVAVTGTGGGGSGSGLVADDDYGDVTVSGTGTIWDINDNAVSYDEIQGVGAASRLLGRGSSAGAGNVQELTVGTGLTMSGTSLAVSVPLVSADTGDITFALTGGGNFTTSIDDRSVSFPKMPAAVAGSIFGRSTGAGDGNATTILQGYGIQITNGVIQLDTNLLTWASGVGEVESMAELVAAASGTNHAQLYFVKSYYPGRPGHGDGWWYWDPNSEYPASGGVVASGISGKFLPVFPNNKIDVTMFGAITKGATATNNNAFQAALFWQQDRTKGGVLYVPIGDYQISSTIRKKTKGTGGAGDNADYLVNNVGGYSIGATNILIDTGVGTFVAGDAVSFGTLLEVSEEYRVIAYNAGTGELQIAHPGLRVAIANNDVVTIHEVPRLAIVGDNHGVTQDASERSVTTSNIIMVTDNIPIIELGGFHNLVQNLTLVYDTFQSNTDTGAACIFNPGSQQMFQNVISGVSMHRGAYGIHVAAGSPSAPNNWFYNILVETASISCVYYNKSGTENWGGGWYLQYVASTRATFTNLIKLTNSTEVTLELTSLPSNAQVGSWMLVSGTSIGGSQYIATLATNSPEPQVKFDLGTNLLNTLVTGGTNGTVDIGPTTQMTAPMFYSKGQWDITGLDVESTIGAADVNVPVFIHNVGAKLTINGLHNEYPLCRVNGQSLIKNSGGALTINNNDLINGGKLSEIAVYVYENSSVDGTTNTRPGHFQVNMFSSRDLSRFTGEAGYWILSTNKAGAPPVVINQFHIDPTLRANATNVIAAGTTETVVTTNLVIP